MYLLIMVHTNKAALLELNFILLRPDVTPDTFTESTLLTTALIVVSTIIFIAITTAMFAESIHLRPKN